MNSVVKEISASHKFRIPLKRLEEMIGTEQSTSNILIPSLLIEISDVSEFEAIINIVFIRKVL